MTAKRKAKPIKTIARKAKAAAKKKVHAKPKAAGKKRVGKLTPVDEEIIRAWVDNGGNQSAAYRTCKPNSLKWKDVTVHKRSSEFFQRREVIGRLASIQEAAEKETNISVASVLNELGKLGYSNMDDFTKKDNETLDLTKLTRDQMAAIQELTHDSDGKVKIKLANKGAALELIGKHFKMFSDKIDVDITGIPESVEIRFRD